MKLAKNLLDTLVLMKSKLDQFFNTRERTSAAAGILTVLVALLALAGKWSNSHTSQNIRAGTDVVQHEAQPLSEVSPSTSAHDPASKVASVQIDGSKIAAAKAVSDSELAQMQADFNELFENFPEMLVLNFRLTETHSDKIGVSASVKWSQEFVIKLVDFFENNYRYKCTLDGSKSRNLQCKHKSGVTYTEEGRFFSCDGPGSACKRPKEEIGDYFTRKGFRSFEIFDPSLSDASSKSGLFPNSADTFYYFDALQFPLCGEASLFIEFSPNDRGNVSGDITLGLTHEIELFSSSFSTGSGLIGERKFSGGSVSDGSIKLYNMELESRNYGGIPVKFITENTQSMAARLKVKCDPVDGVYLIGGDHYRPVELQ